MIETNPVELAKTIDYWDFVTYISETGWSRVEKESSKFMVFNGPLDLNQHPIEIVIPRNENFRELPLYIANAIEILSSINHEEPNSVFQNINTVNRDVLRVRIQGYGTQEAISLRTAAQQVNDLKKLVAYAARSEVDRKPYYIDAQLPAAKEMIDSYRFGHTFRGSFGFTIETPRLKEIHTYQQLDLFPETFTIVPIYRKVMERIARGLMYTDKANKDRDPKWLTENYATGLNANMCRSLADIFGARNTIVEFAITWAPVQLPDDPIIRAFAPIQLDESARNHLDFAAKELVETHEEEMTVTGRIVELDAKASPLELDTSRNIRIQWFEESEGVSYEATAKLGVDDYQKAIEAHKNWYLIEITGTLTHKKDNWRFVNYTRFNVKPIIPEQS